MSNLIGMLSDEEVGQIALLVETLDKSSLDFLQVELGDIKVTIGKGAMSMNAADPAPTGAALALPLAPAAEDTSRSAPTEPTALAELPAPAVASTRETPAATDGTVAIVAPMVGRYYAQSEPGAAPFVSIGVEVNPDTTVALIEVMKVFTAVRAEVLGTVTEICVENDQYVEYGQVLLRVRPTPVDANAKSVRKKSKDKRA